jgi:hypothetical protein
MQPVRPVASAKIQNSLIMILPRDYVLEIWGRTFVRNSLRGSQRVVSKSYVRGVGDRGVAQSARQSLTSQIGRGGDHS